MGEIIVEIAKATSIGSDIEPIDLSVRPQPDIDRAAGHIIAEQRR
jgi:hypothetical protein